MNLVGRKNLGFYFWRPFTVASIKRKYPDINIIKDVTDLYSENYKALKKEIVED
jgi:hypothetical protein